MAQNYFSIVTNIGRNKLALSAAGGAAVTITHFAIGDGNGAEVNPTAANTALVREVWRTPVESVVIDPLNPSAVLVTAIIPTSTGGWWMREFGIFDVAGDMVSVAKPVSQYKPTALEGQLEDIRYEFQIIIGETANVTMLVDPSVLLASRAWVESRKVPVAQLSLTAWVPVKSMTVTAPPANPVTWDTYVVPAGATGAWAGQAQKLAQWTGQTWNIVTPPDGHGISLPDGRVFERINGQYIEKIALDAQSGKWNFAVAGGLTNALTASITPAPTGYASLIGCTLHVSASKTNSGPATFNLNGLGAKPIYNSGGELRGGELIAGEIFTIIFNGTVWQCLGVVQQHIIAPTTLYVNPATGDDNNNGMAANTPFETLQRAVDVVARMFLEDVTVTIQCAASVNYKRVRLRQFSGSGSVIIIGDRVTPSNCQITDSGNIFNNTAITGYTIYGFRLSSTSDVGGVSCCFAVVGGQLIAGDIEYGFCNQYHIYATDGGTFITSYGQKIVGVANFSHMSALNNATIRPSASNRPGLSVAVSGAFDNFVNAERGSVIDFGFYTSITVSGTITGIRASVKTNAIINTNGGGSNYFPGNAAPVIQTGGQYI